MLISISKGVNQLHRTALNKAMNRLNSENTANIADEKNIILVGTKNIATNILSVIFDKHYIILYFTGLGRLYTDFGVLGKSFCPLSNPMTLYLFSCFELYEHVEPCQTLFLIFGF